ncbi:Fur family transcriptional regulator [Desulfobacca acetoxidans]|uniref:Ferric uptake regulator, Fur family n=1 Tax=Desulfobacca acetoxidans (strain ATCC 700848 / DSM 11109 / ASRB2) TaxID=880072 RepID=F2NDC3_DESAR|nr:transcriptional repressor [Desulfobacca acetoxidans]AEB09989.1 ferric uptake regulator, Fur family [Desulfobacca acetoxidans DSM 11109]HAY21046.1 transcriptional repressor [Desulfobacterales bacterium]
MRRPSLQRRIILEELQKQKNHPSVQEIFTKVKLRLPKISLATVYRNLEQLAASGLIHKLEPATGERRFDSELHEHYHIRCVQCGKIADAPLPALPDLDRSCSELSNFTILGHRLEFLGICPQCREQQEKRN